MTSIAFPKHPPSLRSIVTLSRARAASFSSAVGASPSPSPSLSLSSLPLPIQNAVYQGRRQWRHSVRSFATTASSSSVNNDNNDTTTNNDNNNNNDQPEQLRIAIVGGGAAGMTAALHLSPLVASGYIRPVDVYESTNVKKNKNGKNGEKPKKRNSGHGTRACQRGGKQLYPGSGALGRDIGVGIWSTAWWPFLRSLKEGGLSSSSSSSSTAPDADSDSDANDGNNNNDIMTQQKNRQSYRTLLQDLEACGSYVEDVGYRTPNGSWLVKSELNGTPFGINDLLLGDNNDNNNSEGEDSAAGGGEDISKSIDNDDPALLFVREKDLLSCLRNAIKIERRLGTINYHSGVKVDGIENVHGDLGSLVLHPTANDNADENENNHPSLSPQYHLIIAADGLYSSLRSRFAGHHSTHAIGTVTGNSTHDSSSSSSSSKPKDTVEYKWEHTKGQREATQVEDREYIVFRGNAPKLENDEEDGSGSFQTWGEERSMRFAAVPFYHETEDLDDGDEDENDDGSGSGSGSTNGNSSNKGHYSKSQTFISKKKDEEVWFATISDPTFMEAFKKHNSSAIAATTNTIDDESAAADHAIEQKQLLMKAFGSWHKPVQKLIETTRATDIMFEMAVAHRHNVSPVFDVARIMEFEMWQESQKNAKKKEEEEEGGITTKSNNDVAGGECKTISGRGPILAFVGDSCMTVDPVLAQGFTMAMESGASIGRSIERMYVNKSSSTPNYQPKLLRKELLNRSENRERRLLQLLRSTELVQQLAQPHGIGALIATWIVRPVVKLCPEVVKKGVFDYMIRYSLGLTGGNSNDKGGGGK